MKVFFLILFISVGCNLQAQTKREQKELNTDSTMVVTAPKMTAKEMMRELHLSRQQLKQLRELKQSTKAKKDEIEANTQLSDSEKKESLKSMRKNQLQNMKNILTEAQFKKLMELRKSKKNTDEMMTDDQL